jgi:hypothetical protein
LEILIERDTLITVVALGPAPRALFATDFNPVNIVLIRTN